MFFLNISGFYECLISLAKRNDNDVHHASQCLNINVIHTRMNSSVYLQYIFICNALQYKRDIIICLTFSILTKTRKHTDGRTNYECFEATSKSKLATF